MHMIIVALDYKRTDNPLTCTMDGKNMEDLARACGVNSVRTLYDEQATKEAVASLIQEVGPVCREGDYFIFYYSGHGTNLKDVSGDEKDGQDEAFCLVDADGQINFATCMTDDEFVELVTGAVSEEANVLILTDCCHSGTIADLAKDAWSDRRAISITGCLDNETSGDMGRGGIFTHSMLLAIDKLGEKEEHDYAVGALYNATLRLDDKVFNSKQDITINSSSACRPNQMAWPLVPQDAYRAPLHRALGPDQQGAAPAAQADPQVLAQNNVSPALMQHLAAAGLDGAEDLDIDELEGAIHKCSLQ